jgi:hypothetical protein
VRSVLVGLVFVLAALGISVQQEFIAERSSEPPHRERLTGAAMTQDYPDSLGVQTDVNVWATEWERQEVERIEREAEAERMERARQDASVSVARPRSGTSDAAACTRAHESDTAGGYHAYNPAGPYYGAYQFLRSTWDNVARAMGRDDLVGILPSDASPADQDAAFWALWDDGRGASHFGGRCL